MRHLREGLALTLATGLLVGCGSESLGPSDPELLGYTPEQGREIVQSYFGIARQALAKAGHPEAKKVHLLIVPYGKQAQCGNEDPVKGKAINAEYCPVNNSVVIPEGIIEHPEELVSFPVGRTVDTRKAFKVVLQLVVGHELGHGIQGLTHGTTVRDELQADCYAGFIYRRTHSAKARTQAERNLLWMQGSDSHGTAWERREAVKSGLDGDDCE